MNTRKLSTFGGVQFVESPYIPKDMIAVVQPTRDAITGLTYNRLVQMIQLGKEGADSK